MQGGTPQDAMAAAVQSAALTPSTAGATAGGGGGSSRVYNRSQSPRRKLAADLKSNRPRRHTRGPAQAPPPPHRDDVDFEPCTVTEWREDASNPKNAAYKCALPCTSQRKDSATQHQQGPTHTRTNTRTCALPCAFTRLLALYAHPGHDLRHPTGAASDPALLCRYWQLGSLGVAETAETVAKREAVARARQYGMSAAATMKSSSAPAGTMKALQRAPSLPPAPAVPALSKTQRARAFAQSIRPPQRAKAPPVPQKVKQAPASGPPRRRSVNTLLARHDSAARRTAELRNEVAAWPADPVTPPPRRARAPRAAAAAAPPEPPAPEAAADEVLAEAPSAVVAVGSD